MTLQALPDDSPFYNYCKANLPSFLFDTYTGSDLQRIETLYTSIDTALHNLYTSVTDFMDQLDPKLADPEYLFELGQLLGLVEFENLSKYLNEDGTVNTDVIAEDRYATLLARQRSFIMNSLHRYLLKGTIESIKRLLYSYNMTTSLRELWTEDFLTFNELDNPLITTYGDAVYGSISGDTYQEESYDLITEIVSGGAPSAAGITDIVFFDYNHYNYYYCMDSAGNLLYKTSEEPVNTDFSAETWYVFTELLPVTGNIIKIKLFDDKIYLQTSNNNLVVYNYGLDDPTIEYNISNGTCYFFDILEEESLILIDKGNKIELRDTTENFKIINSAVSKPIDSLDTISYVVSKKSGEYLLVNSAKVAYILQINENIYSIFGGPDTYDLSFYIQNRYYIYKAADNTFTAIEYLPTTELKATYISFDEDNNIVASSSNLSILMSELKKALQYSSLVLLMGSTDFCIYNLNNNAISKYSYVSGAYTYSNIFLLDKFYLEKYSGTILQPFSKITAWNSFTNQVFKTHYFDILIELGNASLSATIDLAINDLKDYINDIISYVKPIHTELRLIASLLYVDESSFLDDTDSTSEITSGGSEYTLTMIAHYDGRHPYKSATHALHNDNDGNNGVGILKYGYNNFTLSGATSAGDFDNFIFNNIPLP